jgi:hypothetical protein
MMKSCFKTIYLVVITILIFTEGQSQEPEKKTGIINFFLDCYHCDFTFVRQELDFVSFVREPQLADVHILVTESNTGGGGSKFFFNFIGLKEFKGLDYDYTIITNQSDSYDDIRKALLKIIKIGILPYYSKTDFLNNINIDLEESGNRKAGDMVIDRWNKWVFRLESGGEFQKEESQNKYSLDTQTSAERITEEWKTSLEASYEINRENYFDEGTKITNKQDTKQLSAELIKSLTEKWSAGIFGDYSSRTFLNIKNKFSTAAGIQYNVFPWKECNRRVFAIGYGVGLDIYDYNDTTIYDKMHESHGSEILMINLKLIQPWGEISVGLEGQNYFHDFSKNRLTLESDISLRLTKNLSVYCEIQSQLIHDQFYLPKGDASLEDILLERRKLATTYEVSGRLGFQFTFGSIYNNVVNERF